jgi:hypothetical protein
MPSPTKRTCGVLMIFSLIRCCSSLTPGLLKPAFKPLGGLGVLGPDGLTPAGLTPVPPGFTKGLWNPELDPGFLNVLIVTSAFFVVINK